MACATERGHIPPFFSDALYPTGGRPPPRELSRRSTGIETRGRTRNRVSHPGRGSIGGFAPLGTSLHARNSAFGLGNSDEISDIDAAGVFRGSTDSIRNSQSPVGVRIHAAEAGPVSTCKNKKKTSLSCAHMRSRAARERHAHTAMCMK